MVFTLRIGEVFHVKSSCLLWFDFAVLHQFFAVAPNIPSIVIPTMVWYPEYIKDFPFFLEEQPAHRSENTIYIYSIGRHRILFGLRFLSKGEVQFSPVVRGAIWI